MIHTVTNKNLQASVRVDVGGVGETLSSAVVS